MIRGTTQKINYRDFISDIDVSYELNPIPDEDYLTSNLIAASSNSIVFFHKDPLVDNHIVIYTSTVSLNAPEIRNWQKSLIKYFAEERRQLLIFFNNNSTHLHCFPVDPLSIRERSSLVELVQNSHKSTSCILLDDFTYPLPDKSFRLQFSLSAPLVVRYLFNTNIKFYISKLIIPYSPLESEPLDEQIFENGYDWTTISKL